jgi:hypothetical protein
MRQPPTGPTPSSARLDDCPRVSRIRLLEPGVRPACGHGVPRPPEAVPGGVAAVAARVATGAPRAAVVRARPSEQAASGVRHVQPRHACGGPSTRHDGARVLRQGVHHHEPHREPPHARPGVLPDLLHHPRGAAQVPSRVLPSGPDDLRDRDYRRSRRPSSWRAPSSS